MKIIIIVLILIVIIFLTYHIISECIPDQGLYRKLCNDKYITVEFIKNKQMHLSIGNKFTNSENYRIPFIIYRTWKNNDLTEQFIDAWNTTAINNPEFEQKLYTDLGVNNFINDFDYPGLKKAYNRINPKYGAARADLFRYAILYKNGGFYMDIKTFPKCSIKTKLGNNDGIILSKWEGSVFYKGNKKFFRNHSLTFAEKLGEWEQYWLACEKQHPMMKAILDRCIKNILEPHTNNLLPKDKNMLNDSSYVIYITTGPLMMTYVIDNFIINNPDFKDYTITRPSFDHCIQYTNFQNFAATFKGHWTAYSKNNEKHYSQLSQSTEPLLIY